MILRFPKKTGFCNELNITALMIMQARLVGKASHAGGFSEHDEYVPMVDKTVDVGWKEKQATSQNSLGSTTG